MTVPKLTLYNSNLCPYAARSVIALAETNQEHEVVAIDLAVPRPEWYLKDINPYGQVPALKVGEDHIILESLLVSEYIADLHPEAGLLPSDPLQRAQVRYLIHHWGARTQPAIHKASFTLDTTEARKHLEDLIVELEKVDALLRNVHRKESDGFGQGAYFLGDKFSFAEVALAPFLARVFLLESYNGNKLPTAAENPKIARFLAWKDAVTKRPSVIKSTPAQETLTTNYRKWVK
ncbi:hypothetical protein CPC16_010325 [Podila verticillata]|nr:hypothetical protein CPC16_010325 [Podila verticillata]